MRVKLGRVAQEGVRFGLYVSQLAAVLLVLGAGVLRSMAARWSDASESRVIPGSRLASSLLAPGASEWRRPSGTHEDEDGAAAYAHHRRDGR